MLNEEEVFNDGTEDQSDEQPDIHSWVDNEAPIGSLVWAKTETVERILSTLGELDVEEAVEMDWRARLIEAFGQPKGDKRRKALLAIKWELANNATSEAELADAKFLGDHGWIDSPPPLPEPVVAWREKYEQERILIPQGRVGFIIGAGGIGKSFAVLDLALSVASGQPWFGHKEFLSTPGRVLLVAAEDEGAEVAHRLSRMAKDNKRYQPDTRTLLEKNLCVWPRSGKNNCLVTMRDGEPVPGPFADTLLRRLNDRQPWAMVILDPASRHLSPEAEINNWAATDWVRRLEDLAKTVKGNPAVVVVHHTRKSDRRGTTTAESARGSSALVDGARYVVTLSTATLNDLDGTRSDEGKRSTDIITWRHAKANHGPRAPDIHLMMDDGRLKVANQGDVDAAISRAKDRAPKASSKTKTDPTAGMWKDR